MNKDLISVVVPVYKVENYVQKCINSILNQSYTNLELILVDDGSPDKSGIICDENAKLDERIKVIHKENGGLSDARNIGIEAAVGKYITFVDSDDFISPFMIEKLYTNLIEYTADISCCDMGIIKNCDDNINLSCDNVDLLEFNKIEAIKETLYQRKIDNSACAKLYKKELFENIRYPKSMYFEDLATTYKIFLSAQKIVAVNQPLYYYYQRETSILHQKNEKLVNDLFYIIEDLATDLKLYNELHQAIICRSINAYFYIYRNTSNKNLKKECINYIRTNRREAIRDNNISKKTKYGLYISFISFNLVNIIYKIKNSL